MTGLPRISGRLIHCLAIPSKRGAVASRRLPMLWKRKARKATTVLEFLCRNPLHAHIRLQRRRNEHAAVGLLIVFEDGQPGAPNRQPAAVEGVHEFGLLASLGPPADVRPPCLN